jgi:peptidoglycan/xylan/chitin deacetylase (PgdA/CDA1 family)
VVHPVLKRAAITAAMETLHFSGLDRLPPLARPGLGAVLTFHHVGPMATDAFDPNRGLTVTADFLDRALAHLKTRGFRFVDLAELHHRLTRPAADNGDGARVLAVTLDDGYRDNRDVALPVFEKHGVPITVFVAPGFAERREILWWEVLATVLGRRTQVAFDFGAGEEAVPLATTAAKIAAWQRFTAWVNASAPRAVLDAVARLAARAGVDALAMTADLVMDRDETIAFARHPLVTIGAHTLTHANLRNLDRAAALAEMVGSADRLAGWLGARPRFLAYPYGYPAAAGPDQFALAAEAGFDLAFTTRPGVLLPAHRDHLTALPRLSVNGDFQKLRYLDVLLSGAPIALKTRLRMLDVA